jgi:hypothetical protein
MIILNEEQFQAACYEWWHNTYARQPQYAKRLFCVDNNVSHRVKGLARVAEGNRKQAVGVVAGVSDMIFIGKGFIAFIELKMEKGVLGKEQLEFRLQVLELGHQYYVIRYDGTIVDFQILIKNLINGKV